MKYLIQHTYSVLNPWYLIPNFLNYYIGRTPLNDKLRFGVGKQDERLFEKGQFDGTELTGIITGIFRKNWQFNKSRISAFKRGLVPIEALHACTADSKFEKRSRADWNLNLWRDNDYTRNGIAATLYLAKDLIDEVPIVNFHMGKYRSEDVKFVVASLINNLRFAEEIAKQEGIVITLENDYQKYEEEHAVGSDIDLIYGIMEEVNSPHVKVCYDWGHANVQAKWLFNKGGISKKQLQSFAYHKKFIKKLGKHIAYSHLHYNTAHEIDNVSTESSIFYPSTERNGDLHMPLNRISEEDRTQYIEILKLLRDKTLIPEYGKIMLELTRDKIFGLPFNKSGANTQDALDSLKMVREIFEK